MTCVTIVLPLYNPKGDWAGQFIRNKEKLNALLPEINFSYIVVHDGPMDGLTSPIADVVQAAHPDVTFYSYEKNRGKGYAWRLGVSRSNTPFTIVMDFDFPYELQNIKEVLQILQEGAEVVTGKRAPSYFSKLPLKRKLISKSYALCNRLLLRLPTSDTQSGLKGFNHVGKTIFLQTTIDRFLIDTEFLLRAKKNRLAITILPFKLREGILFSDFGCQVLKTELSNFLFLIRLQKQLRSLPRPIFQPSVFPTRKMIKLS